MEIQDTEFTDLRGQDLEDHHFIGCQFLSTDLRGARLIDTTFERCVILTPRLDAAALTANFIGCKIEGVNFFTANRTFLSLSFEDTVLRYCSFASLKIRDTKFTNCELTDIDFAECDLTGSSFASSRFSNPVFNRTNLTKCDFVTASGYMIDPSANTVKNAKFSLPEVLSMLGAFDIIIE